METPVNFGPRRLSTVGAGVMTGVAETAFRQIEERAVKEDKTSRKCLPNMVTEQNKSMKMKFGADQLKNTLRPLTSQNWNGRKVC